MCKKDNINTKEKNNKIASGILQIGIYWAFYETIRYYKIFYDIFRSSGKLNGNIFMYNTQNVEIPRIIGLDYRFLYILVGYILIMELKYKYSDKIDMFIDKLINSAKD